MILAKNWLGCERERQVTGNDYEHWAACTLLLSWVHSRVTLGSSLRGSAGHEKRWRWETGWGFFWGTLIPHGDVSLKRRVPLPTELSKILSCFSIYRSNRGILLYIWLGWFWLKTKNWLGLLLFWQRNTMTICQIYSLFLFVTLKFGCGCTYVRRGLRVFACVEDFGAAGGPDWATSIQKGSICGGQISD